MGRSSRSAPVQSQVRQAAARRRPGPYGWTASPGRLRAALRGWDDRAPAVGARGCGGDRDGREE